MKHLSKEDIRTFLGQLQEGREIRVFVKPGDINYLQAHQLTKDIAKRIEEELKYPGEIKVTLIRENRFVEVAK